MRPWEKEPVRLVVKHTFLEVEAEDTGMRRSSDSHIKYSSMFDKSAQPRGRRGSFGVQSVQSSNSVTSETQTQSNLRSPPPGLAEISSDEWADDWQLPQAQDDWQRDDWNTSQLSLYGAPSPYNPCTPSWQQDWAGAWSWRPYGPSLPCHNTFGPGISGCGVAGARMSTSHPATPRTKNAGALVEDDGFDSGRTTVMLQNLPDDYSRDMVVELLDKQGFRGLYDFVYVPMNFRTKSSFGYAFINFVSPLVTKTCWEKLQGFLCWTVPSDRVCNMSWSVHQGLKAHIRRYRNSPVMHETVPDEYKPAVFTHGVRDPFPPPTKKVRVPRIRRSHGEGVEGDEGDMEQHGLVP